MTGRTCKTCREWKDSSSFTPFKDGKNGLYPHCRDCRKLVSKEQWKEKPYVQKIYDRCKGRALRSGLEFSIDLGDIIIPDRCPVFGVEMTGRYAPSLDRIDSSKGYIKGNVQVISTRANMIKSDATPEELAMVAKFVTVGAVNDG